MYLQHWQKSKASIVLPKEIQKQKNLPQSTISITDSAVATNIRVGRSMIAIVSFIKRL